MVKEVNRTYCWFIEKLLAFLTWLSAWLSTFMVFLPAAPQNQNVLLLVSQFLLFSPTTQNNSVLQCRNNWDFLWLTLQTFFWRIVGVLIQFGAGILSCHKVDRDAKNPRAPITKRTNFPHTSTHRRWPVSIKIRWGGSGGLLKFIEVNYTNYFKNSYWRQLAKFLFNLIDITTLHS